MKKSYVFLAIVALLIIVAAITNPDISKHKEAVKSELKVAMQGIVKDELNDETKTVDSALGMMLGGALVDQMIENMLSTDNYMLFSVTKVTLGDKTKAIGFGVFGNVFISGKLKEAVEQGIDEAKSR